MNFDFKKTKAFSFIEMILYIAIVSIMMTTILLFGIQLLENRGEAEKNREVLDNTRFAMNRLVEEIRHADSLDSGTGTFGSHPSSISLLKVGTGSVVFDTATKTVTQGSTDYVIRYLRIDEDGSGPVQITSDSVNITNFVVNDLTRSTETSNLQIELSLETIVQDSSVSIQTASSLRR